METYLDCHAAALRKAARRVSQLYDEALAPAGIGINQLSILAHVRAAGPSTIADLARRLVMDRSTLGHLVRPLEERGLVRLRTGERDRRTRELTLTREGVALLKKARPLWQRAPRQFERGVGAQASHELRAALNEVAAIEFA